MPVGWNSTDVSGPFGYYANFTYQDRNNDYWVYRGLHAGLPPLQAGQYHTNNNTFGPLPTATAVLNQAFAYYIQTSRRAISLTIEQLPPLPSGLSIQTTNNSLFIGGVPGGAGSNWLTLVVEDTGDDTFATNYLSLNVVSNGTVVALGPLVINSTNQYSEAIVSYTNRPPQLAQPPVPTNSFTMQFYYVTQDSFAWPGIADPPPSGSIVPYLRPQGSVGEVRGRSHFVKHAQLEYRLSAGFGQPPRRPYIRPRLSPCRSMAWPRFAARAASSFFISSPSAWTSSMPRPALS